MQNHANKMRNDLWSNLKAIYDVQSNGKDEITTVQVENIVKNIMKQTDQYELEYIFKNLFRLDTDGSGTVDFNEFANFFLKRHCGEIALQKAHKTGLICKSNQRKLSEYQFLTLLTEAYSFLNVQIDKPVAIEIFKFYDSDKDNFITYVEYFSFIDKCICKNKDVLKVETQKSIITEQEIKINIITPEEKTHNSRTRLFFGQNIKKIFDSFDINQTGLLQIQQVKTLVCDILDLESQKDIDFIISTMYDLGLSQSVKYEDFYTNFIQQVGNYGLSQFILKDPGMNKSLNKNQFVKLFKSTYDFLPTYQIQDDLLFAFFNKIDTLKQEQISFDQYLGWIKNYICPFDQSEKFNYLDLDDVNLQVGQKMICDDQFLNTKSMIISSSTCISTKKDNEDVNSFQLSKKARTKMFTLLSFFDKNNDSILQQKEIAEILKTLLNKSEIDIQFSIRNIFWNNKNGCLQITLIQMTNFLLQVHCAETSLQRLHYQNGYKLGARRLMDLQEFNITLNESIKILEFQASEQQLRIIFQKIDTDRDGFISYKEYFQYMKTYFEAKSQIKNDNLMMTNNSFSYVNKISEYDKFANWIQKQSNEIFQGKIQSLMKVDVPVFEIILRQVFQEMDTQINYSVQNLFDEFFNAASIIDQEDAKKIFLLIHIGFTVIFRCHRQKKHLRWNDKLLNQNQFVNLINEATIWANNPYDQKSLKIIFIKLDSDQDGFISYLKYFKFIEVSLGLPPNQDLWCLFQNRFSALFQSNLNIQQMFPTTTQNIEELCDRIWNKLRECFCVYLKDGNQTLQKDDIKLLIADIFQQQNQQEIDKIFSNYFRLEKDNDDAVEFQQFAPFIINQNTEIALQKFHHKHLKAYNVLTITEFVGLMNFAFVFLEDISKQITTLQTIFSLLDTDKDGYVNYKQYLVWSRNLAYRYK